MKAYTLWKVLRARLRRSDRGRAPRITLQHVLPSDRDLALLQTALDRVGVALAVDFELQAHRGDIVLMDAEMAGRMSPQLVSAFTEERPLVTVTGSLREDEQRLPAAERVERRQRELLLQLRELPLVRQRAGAVDPASQGQPSQGWDSGFDSQLHADELQAAELEHGRRDVVQRVLRGVRAPHVPVLFASYGPLAHLRFDFRARLVTLDSLALQHLRVRRELPRPALPADAQPGAEAQVRDLEETLWDLGLACGPYPLFDEPADWWHMPLCWVPQARIERYSRVPRHLELARLLQAAPQSPSGLRRQARVGIAELRSFVQAALMTGLAQWHLTPAAQADSL